MRASPVCSEALGSEVGEAAHRGAPGDHVARLRKQGWAANGGVPADADVSDRRVAAFVSAFTVPTSQFFDETFILRK